MALAKALSALEPPSSEPLVVTVDVRVLALVLVGRVLMLVLVLALVLVLVLVLVLATLGHEASSFEPKLSLAFSGSRILEPTISEIRPIGCDSAETDTA
jgi:hypothetical protein